MKGFYAIIIALILIACCLLGSITPFDDDEGVGFGIIGLIFAGIVFAAMRCAFKESEGNVQAKSDRIHIRFSAVTQETAKKEHHPVDPCQVCAQEVIAFRKKPVA